MRTLSINTLGSDKVKAPSGLDGGVERGRRRRFSPGCVLAAGTILALFLPPADIAYSQRPDGVFVGHGRIARTRPSSTTGKVTSTGGSAPDRRGSARDPGSLSDETVLRIESLERSCFDEVNHQREARGLEPLDFSEELLSIARNYSRRMADEGFFSHSDAEGGTVRERVGEAGIKWRVLGENLAFTNGYVNAVAATMRGWMSSPGHRHNILFPDYRQTAVGAWINRSGTVYFTEIFLE